MLWFMQSDEIKSFEDSGQWIEAIDFIWAKWNLNRDNEALLLRCITECWIVLVDWFEDSSNHNPDFPKIQIMGHLVECTEYGLIHFADSPIILFVIGYMSVLFPFMFYIPRDNDRDYDNQQFVNWENKGMMLLKRAYELRPNDPIIEMYYRGTYERHQQDKSKYSAVVRRAYEQSRHCFTDQTAFERYFKRMLDTGYRLYCG